MDMDRVVFCAQNTIKQSGIFGLEETLDFVIENAIEMFATFGANGSNILINPTSMVIIEDIRSVVSNLKLMNIQKL